MATNGCWSSGVYSASVARACLFRYPSASAFLRFSGADCFNGLGDGPPLCVASKLDLVLSCDIMMRSFNGY